MNEKNKSLLETISEHLKESDELSKQNELPPVELKAIVPGSIDNKIELAHLYNEFRLSEQRVANGTLNEMEPGARYIRDLNIRKIEIIREKFDNKFKDLLGIQDISEINDLDEAFQILESNEKQKQYHPAVVAFASAAHEQWRKGFDPENTGKERVKKNSDGSEGNINVPFHKLHPDWQKENLAAGHAAKKAIELHPNNLEKAAEHVHNEWMKRNPKADYNAAQHVPYSELPEHEKQKDRDHVNQMISLLALHKEKNNVNENFIHLVPHPNGYQVSKITPQGAKKIPNYLSKDLKTGDVLTKKQVDGAQSLHQYHNDGDPLFAIKAEANKKSTHPTAGSKTFRIGQPVPTNWSKEKREAGYKNSPLARKNTKQARRNLAEKEIQYIEELNLIDEELDNLVHHINKYAELMVKHHSQDDYHIPDMRDTSYGRAKKILRNIENRYGPVAVRWAKARAEEHIDNYKKDASSEHKTNVLTYHKPVGHPLRVEPKYPIDQWARKITKEEVEKIDETSPQRALGYLRKAIPKRLMTKLPVSNPMTGERSPENIAAIAKAHGHINRALKKIPDLDQRREIEKVIKDHIPHLLRLTTAAGVSKDPRIAKRIPSNKKLQGVEGLGGEGGAISQAKQFKPNLIAATKYNPQLYQKEETEQLYEKAPPGMEEWIKDRKEGFKERYGDRWEEVLYRTAWKMYNKKEEVEQIDEVSQHVPGSVEHLTDLLGRVIKHRKGAGDFDYDYEKDNDPKLRSIRSQHRSALRNINKEFKVHFGHLRDAHGNRVNNISDYPRPEYGSPEKQANYWMHDLNRHRPNKTNEEVEQIDEISQDLIHRAYSVAGIRALGHERKASASYTPKKYKAHMQAAKALRDQQSRLLFGLRDREDRKYSKPLVSPGKLKKSLRARNLKREEVEQIPATLSKIKAARKP